MGFNLDNDESRGGGFFGKTGMAEINITPFVDVVLVLLIIFMVAAPLAVTGINVQLPAAKTKTVSMNEDPIILSVTETGAFFLGKTEVKSETLTEKLKAARGSSEEAQLYIRADTKVPYGKVMEAMAAAQIAGISKIGMLGESSATGKK